MFLRYQEPTCLNEIGGLLSFYSYITIERLFCNRRLSACIALAKSQSQPCDTREEGNDCGSYYADSERERKKEGERKREGRHQARGVYTQGNLTSKLLEREPSML